MTSSIGSRQNDGCSWCNCPGNKAPEKHGWTRTSQTRSGPLCSIASLSAVDTPMTPLAAFAVDIAHPAWLSFRC
jgi:hypothetical protein